MKLSPIYISSDQSPLADMVNQRAQCRRHGGGAAGAKAWDMGRDEDGKKWTTTRPHMHDESCSCLAFDCGPATPLDDAANA